MDSSDSETSIQTKSLKCTIPGCNASFSKKSKLDNHTLKHTGERPFVCDEEGCNKTYRNNSHLRRHKKTSHGEREETERILCDYKGCGAVFASKYSLKKHCICKHNSEQYLFKCGECSQGFDRKKQLQHHSYLHTGEATFSCDKCDMKFITNYHLKKHKRNHRDYYCDCGEVFYQWSLLLMHKRLCHKKKFVCDVCRKAFSQEAKLKNHKISHLDNSQRKVFVCGYKDCKRFFFYKRNLKHHIVNFHMKINEHQTFKCTYPKCQVVLKTKQSQRHHLERHFKLKVKKKRNTRWDKGIPKKSISSILVVADSPRESDEEVNSEKNVAKNSLQQEPIYMDQDITEQGDPILRECEVALKRINEKLVSAS